MKRRLLFILVIGLVLGALTGMYQRPETPSFTAKTVTKLYKQMTNTSIEARDVYFVERLSEHYAVAYLEAKHDRLFLLLQQTDEAQRIDRIIRAKQTTEADWFEGRLLATPEGRYLVAYGMNGSKQMKTIRFEPYKTTADGEVPLRPMQRSLTVAGQERFHTVQPLPDAFPHSLYFEMIATRMDGKEMIQRLTSLSENASAFSMTRDF
ncbi:hypothetical protein [Exiguobacterium sp. R-17]|uniref:hypothetical protein n=1 Tax=Exiguobacterium sp. R-17 TaxID=3404054 RepID=UPI003CEC408E